MDSQQIRLSTLGRDVQVGDLYNYYADSIFTSRLTQFYLKQFSDRFDRFHLYFKFESFHSDQFEFERRLRL